ncbi:MAG: MBL fold metallo-hydrolase [Oscillospiraceae bacterium]|nr:MBL fold metallo-hydrolase [Oscillospiraceae bacterium]
MKITFLGTSASEEYPGIWCDCVHCARARALGGRNIRRNSAIFIDGDTMIDMGKTAHIQAERFGLNMRNVTTLLVTHSHHDHFDTHTLWARQMTPSYDTLPDDAKRGVSSPRFTALPRLAIVGSERVSVALAAQLDYTKPACGIDFIIVQPYREYIVGDIRVFTLAGNHDDNGSPSINYIVTRGGRTFAYLTDSGWPHAPTLDALKNYKYDFVINEGTFGLGMDSEGHMRLEKNIRLLRFFNENNLWKNAPDFILTHLAPHWSPPHDDYAPVVEAQGMKLAYDGLALEYPY